MKKLKIKTEGKEYPVFTGSGIFNSVPELIKSHNLHKNIFLIIDGNVNKFYGETIRNAFRNYKEKLSFFVLEPGEQSKSFDVLNRILSELITNEFGRDTLITAVGGGVTGDLAGFAASIYMRGVQLIHIPTTLLAMVDSSIGGKTGINFNKYKNIIGAFFQPEFILIDTDFLKTLPEGEINSGVGELIKYAFLTNTDFYNYLNQNLNYIYLFNEKILSKLIFESVLFKGSVVMKDEKERGLRKILNLGHTFAHAYESNTDLKLKHGEAVIAGIISALFLSNKEGFLSDKKLNHFLELPMKINLKDRFNTGEIKSVLEFMRGDKKNRDGKVKFVLLKNIGRLITDYAAGEENIIFSIDKTTRILKGQTF